MTREEADAFLYSIAGDLGFIEIENYTCKDGEKMREAIKALEQEPCDKCVYSTKDGCCQYDDITETIPPFEPCEDAISRQAVLNLPRKALKNYFGEVIAGVIDVRDVMELPPVTPQPKMGHWIEGKYKDTCDKCRCTYPKNIGFKKYCPNCGAKMEEEK